MTRLRFALRLLALAGASPLAHADRVVTADGSVLQGQIAGIAQDVLTLSTSYAGEIEIDMAQVDHFDTDSPVYLSFGSGSAYFGEVEGREGGELEIRTSDGELATSIAEVAEGWRQGDKSPAQRRREAELAKLERAWKYEASFDLTGKSGNSDAIGLASSFEATLQGPEDTLVFYAGANFSETDDEKSADDLRGGVDYSSQFSDHWNWYTRAEVGRDRIEDLEFYSTGAAGFSYIATDSERRRLAYRGGLSFRFESFEDGQTVNSPGLDLSLIHRETFSWGVLDNSLTYLPVFEDFGTFRVIHDSGLELPLSAEGWRLRMGVRNNFNSEPQPGKTELDTTYYTRLLLNWE